MQLVQLARRAVQVLLIQVVFRARKDAQHVVPRDEPLPAERERRQHMRRDVCEHACVLVGHERNTRHGRRDACREPRREVREGLDADVRRLARFERVQCSANYHIVPRRRGVAEHAQFVAERSPFGCVDDAVYCTQGGPERVDA